MRRLTAFESESEARLFCDALYADGIETTIRPDNEKGVSVWVHDDERMDDARSALNAFQSGAERERFRELAKNAHSERVQQEREDRKLEQRTQRIRQEWESQRGGKIAHGSLFVIAVSIVFAVITELGDNNLTLLFTFSDPSETGRLDWQQIAEGEAWRLLTPAFLHFNFLHILFNVWWVKDLGSAIEYTFRTRYFVLLFLCIALFSHLFQVLVFGFSMFGGLSGVVYGLFGFIWIRGRSDPSFPLHMPPSLTVFMIAWFLLGFSGFVGPIANGVHSGGLVIGSAWGWISAKLSRRINGI